MYKKLRLFSSIVFIGSLVIHAQPGSIPTHLYAYTFTPPIGKPNSTREEFESPDGYCIPSGDHMGIQNALVGVGAEAVLCPDAVFELGETIYFTADSQSIYTEGLPTDDSRALLRVVGDGVATAVSAEGNDYVSLRNVISDSSLLRTGPELPESL